MLANFTKGSLLVAETQAVARLLLEQPDSTRWKQAIEVENVLQVKTMNTAKSYANIARMRLQTMDEGAWEIVAFGERESAIQAILACAVKFSPLFAEFMRGPLKEEYRRLSASLEDRVWRSFYSDMALLHPSLAGVSENSQSKLRQNAFRMLTEAGYLSKDNNRSLQYVRIMPDIKNYLRARNHLGVLAALECTT